MKEFFEQISFDETCLKLIELCNRIIDRYARQGYDLSLRQLFYQLVTINAIPNSTYAYEKLGKVVTDARLAGLIDWDMIVDRGRVTRAWKAFSSPGKAVKQLVSTFRFNRWRNQKFYIELCVEKQALEGVLVPVCGKWGINFTANKGYSSASALYSMAKRLARKVADKKQVVVFYLGDHDPSGLDMTRDLRDRLSMFARVPIDVKRLALNHSQVDKWKLPPNPAKLTDSRASAYVEKHGTSSWELDAVPPKKLCGLVDAAVMRRLDMAAWETDGFREERAVRLLRQATKSLDAEFKGTVESTTVSDVAIEGTGPGSIPFNQAAPPALPSDSSDDSLDTGDDASV